MKKDDVFLGNSLMKNSSTEITADFIDIDKERYYYIRNYHKMPDFFISIVSDSDHWMFISSNGSLSAGRKNRDNALFPYYTEDKIHDYKDITGSKSIFLVEKNNKTYLWEPFTDQSKSLYSVSRNICKSIYGNKILFEEINHDLGLSFHYKWMNSEKYGFVKQSVIKNLNSEKINIRVLDGIRNILPYGIDYAFQNEYSNLLDAYKKNEKVEDTSLGLFVLSSIPVDKAEPSESLKTTTVWSTGLADSKILVSDRQMNDFRFGSLPEEEMDIRASRGAYFVNSEVWLESQKSETWYLVAEINQDSSDVVDLIHLLKNENDLAEKLQEDVHNGTQRLISLVAKADGLQKSQEELTSTRHYSNTLFNIMRGGIYQNGYIINIQDLKNFTRQTNPKIFEKHEKWFLELGHEIHLDQLHMLAKKEQDPHLIRILYEYLPLTFSRRHGDPSRPWNIFSIETRNEDGSEKLSYEGNWRDIFQNWEALNLAFPEYIENIISKFLNASTADGYNPYRITRNGIDWEAPDPDDPWAYIGYWGDHQIIYLQKFLEQSYAFHPGKLDELMTGEYFVYANVPYRIKTFDDIVKNPQDTILFDHQLNDEITKLVSKGGSDERLLKDMNGNIYRVNLTEKILASLLSKLSNFIPEAGIWLNTQRPEWNDANNALVGNGTSMVTLYYLRRFINFWYLRFSETRVKEFSISEELTSFFENIHKHFKSHSGVLKGNFTDKQRWEFTSLVGKEGSIYRQNIYKNSFSGTMKKISTEKLLEFTSLVLQFLDHSIQKNKREDGLYHAYNLISFNNEGVKIRHLYEMLEGQVAVLSSGYLSSEESLELLNNLKNSKLFRADQYSYLLYPDRQLPRFDEKNMIPGDLAKNSELFSKLITDKNTSIIKRDINGGLHFNGMIRNKNVLIEKLELLDDNIYGTLVRKEKEKILDIYEKLFDHQSFTGRSGTFYGYEGLGCIYWHMVSKLLLATEECFFRAVKEAADDLTVHKLKEHYYEIKAGIGLYKSPELYGAFPSDAYSHTPGNSGAKQPGLTGQVKEDVISRIGELGIHVSNGTIEFNTQLLNTNELLTTDDLFTYTDQGGIKQSIQLVQGQMAFTFCQIPVIYSKGKVEKLIVHMNDDKREITGNTISREISREIFSRTGKIKQIELISNKLEA